MHILVTGSRGFIGKNLVVRISEVSGYKVIKFNRGDNVDKLPSLLTSVDAVVHLAGENRSEDIADFAKNNAFLTETLCQAISNSNRQIPLIMASSTQANLENPYGQSKRRAEIAVEQLGRCGNPTVIFRLPGVFGKWCKPNYNSVVATFCHNIAKGLPIQINDASVILKLVYIDDVVSAIINSLQAPKLGLTQSVVKPEYLVSLGELAAQIRAFSECRASLTIDRVGVGLVRALYATYVSYLPKDKFSYEVPHYEDLRGVFVEMLKTSDSGQFSFFTVLPSKTRGGHYHHTKTEKFLVIKGKALFRFRHLITDEPYELRTSVEKPTIVDTIPGWSHDITNIGNEELVVMLWANEVFDRDNPDTVSNKV